MQRALGLVLTMVAVAAGWLFALPASPVAQPIGFNHARHAPLTCAACHRGAADFARAGLPSRELCTKCHATAPAGAVGVAWDGGQQEPIGWVRLTRVPDHVMFSHRRHVTIAKLDCASCHGDISRSTSPPPRALVRVEMETCLACHRQEGASEDCAACHR